MGLIFITHDLAVVAGLADRVAVMRHGEIVETGETAHGVPRPARIPTRGALFAASSHVPTRQPPPRCRGGARRCCAVESVVRDYRLPRRTPVRPRRRLPRRRRRQLHASSAARMSAWSAKCGSRQVHPGPRHHGARAAAGRRGACSTARRSTPSPAPRRRRGARCRWCSRTPTARSTRAIASTRLVTEPFHLLGADAPRGAERRRRIAEALETVGLDAGRRRQIHRTNSPAASASASPSPGR